MQPTEFSDHALSVLITAKGLSLVTAFGGGIYPSTTACTAMVRRPFNGIVLDGS